MCQSCMLRAGVNLWRQHTLVLLSSPLQAGGGRVNAEAECRRPPTSSESCGSLALNPNFTLRFAVAVNACFR